MYREELLFVSKQEAFDLKKRMETKKEVLHNMLIDSTVNFGSDEQSKPFFIHYEMENRAVKVLEASYRVALTCWLACENYGNLEDMDLQTAASFGREVLTHELYTRMLWVDEYAQAMPTRVSLSEFKTECQQKRLKQVEKCLTKLAEDEKVEEHELP